MNRQAILAAWLPFTPSTVLPLKTLGDAWSLSRPFRHYGRNTAGVAFISHSCPAFLSGGLVSHALDTAISTLSSLFRSNVLTQWRYLSSPLSAYYRRLQAHIPRLGPVAGPVATIQGRCIQARSEAILVIVVPRYLRVLPVASLIGTDGRRTIRLHLFRINIYTLCQGYSTSPFPILKVAGPSSSASIHSLASSVARTSEAERWIIRVPKAE